jgi:GxxExxY protein
MNVKQQQPLTVFDENGTIVGEYLADVIVEDVLILELKAYKAIADEHISQLLGYLRASRIEHPAVVNFGGPKSAAKLLQILFSPLFALFG